MNCIKFRFIKTSDVFPQIFDISKIILSSNLSNCNPNMQFSFEIFSCNYLVTICPSSREFERNFRNLKPPSVNF